jgi:hypothetical protein
MSGYLIQLMEADLKIIEKNYFATGFLIRQYTTGTFKILLSNAEMKRQHIVFTFDCARVIFFSVFPKPNFL